VDSDDDKVITLDATDPRVLRLPWELLADEGGHLFAKGVGLRRRMQKTTATKTHAVQLPVRILVVVARPDEAGPHWFATIGGRTVVLSSDDATDDAWWSTADVGWLLQRPDFQIYGTAADAAGASELIVHLRDRLTDPTSTATTPSTEGTSA
jgi:hypothetical protein